jgi:hypothetical protein
MNHGLYKTTKYSRFKIYFISDYSIGELVALNVSGLKKSICRWQLAVVANGFVLLPLSCCSSLPTVSRHQITVCSSVTLTVVWNPCCKHFHPSVIVQACYCRGLFHLSLICSLDNVREFRNGSDRDRSGLAVLCLSLIIPSYAAWLAICLYCVRLLSALRYIRENDINRKCWQKFSYI